MSDHIKFIYPAQPQKLVLGPIFQGGDRKIKRRGLTEELHRAAAGEIREIKIRDQDVVEANGR